jgi:hypothetical protein
MRPWITAATTILALPAAAVPLEDRPASPLFSPFPNKECQRGVGGLPVPAPGETAGSANPSDQLSRSNGVICPRLASIPAFPCLRSEAISCR